MQNHPIKFRITKLYCFALLTLGSIFTSSASTSTDIQYLSGTGSDDTVEWDFYCSDGMNSGKWDKIGVPSCWELQSFGNYNYGHDPEEERVNEHGRYKHTFEVPSSWKGREIKIVFEGVMTDAEVKINGQLAGPIHQGAFYEFKYSITDKIKYGEKNLLEVTVHKASSNESINQAERHADFWIFGGIYRPVYLQAFPKDHIERVAIDAQADGALTTDLFIDAAIAADVKLTLENLEGKRVQKLKAVDLTKEQGKWRIHSQAKGIKTWNPEDPNLYVLAIDLLDEKGATLHSIKQRIGFRTVEVRESDGIYVNGTKITFKGVNRHSFHPESGRTTNKSLTLEHVKMIKDMNMNAVRMSHYPPDVHFLDACDEYGLFVIDEVCTWHSPHLDTEVGKKIVKETVIRDVNHPSIILWANGNETGWNTELDDDYAQWDIQKREVIHPWNVFRKTNTLHYPQYHALAYDGPNKDRITFHTEFLHGLYDGGHGAGLEDYWNQIWNKPLAAGGFLWVFADEFVARRDKNNELDSDGNHAPDGITGPYGEKEASYFSIKEIWSPIHIEDRFIRDSFNGVFQVENRYHYTPLSACSMTAKWVNFNGPESDSEPTVLAQSIVSLPDLQPGARGSFRVDMPGNWKSADSLELTAFDPHGMEVFTWTYPVKTPRVLNEQILNQAPAGKLESIQKNGQIQVTAGEYEFRFSQQTGMLVQVTKAGTTIPLSNGPVILGEHDNVETVEIKSLKDKIEITATFEATEKYPNWKGHEEISSDLIKWTVHSSGLLDLHTSMKVYKRNTESKGITFGFPESEVKGMKWLGDGPYRVWRNRMKGTQFKVWENDYNDTVTGESGFVYPEFKGFFSSLYWAKVNGNNDNGFTVYCHTPDIFLRMLTPSQPAAPKAGATVTDFPTGDISFVVNIPAIGTKFKKPEQLGPQSGPENVFGNVDDPLVIDLTFEF